MSDPISFGSVSWFVLQNLYQHYIDPNEDSEIRAISIGHSIHLNLTGPVAEVFLDEQMDLGFVKRTTGKWNDVKYVITAQGVEYFERLISEHAKVRALHASEKWTGDTSRIQISESKRSEILAKMGELRSLVERSNLTNAERSQAMSFLTASIILADAPDPPWDIVQQLLIATAAIATVLSLALQISEMIK